MEYKQLQVLAAGQMSRLAPFDQDDVPSPSIWKVEVVSTPKRLAYLRDFSKPQAKGQLLT
jgi:hypothetical protein